MGRVLGGLGVTGCKFTLLGVFCRLYFGVLHHTASY